MRKSSVEKMICVPLGSEIDITCPTGQTRIWISSHYDCPTFIRLSVIIAVSHFSPKGCYLQTVTNCVSGQETRKTGIEL